jgi:predicted HD phosphohydrolase
MQFTFVKNGTKASFDPDFKSKPLDFFAPMVKRVFARKPYSLI